MDFPILDDFDLTGKKVLLRVDINSPIDPSTMEILDDTRIRSHSPTLEALSRSKTVILAHQSRPGLEDFTTLEKHAQRLQEINGRNVEYIDDIFGSAVKNRINALEDGEILVLENVRFCSEETSYEVINKPPAEQAKTNFVKKLSSYVDFYVNDGFAVSHRAQPSTVGFPEVLPSCAGKVMEKEVKTLSKILSRNAKPNVFIFGGAKVSESFSVMKNILRKGIADSILTSGVVANIFLSASGFDIGKVNTKLLTNAKIEGFITYAKELLRKYRGKIKMPLDLAFQEGGARVEAPVNKLPNSRILDIGIETIVNYSKIIEKGKTVVANGPCGVFEINGFDLGTKEILKSMAGSSAFSVIGGGHLSAIARNINVSNTLSYISTGGKATMYFLAGEKLPGIEALKRRRKR